MSEDIVYRKDAQPIDKALFEATWTARVSLDDEREMLLILYLAYCYFVCQAWLKAYEGKIGDNPNPEHWAGVTQKLMTAPLADALDLVCVAATWDKEDIEIPLSVMKSWVLRLVELLENIQRTFVNVANEKE